MCSGTDILSKVYTPQFRAVESIAVNQSGTGETVMGVVVRVSGIPFQDDLVLAVTVHIPYARIIGGIEVLLAERLHTQSRFIQRYAEIFPGGVRIQREGSLLAALQRLDRIHAVLAAFVLMGQEGRFRQWFGVDLLAVAVDIECLVLGIAGQITPAHRHGTVLGRHRHHSASQRLHL